MTEFISSVFDNTKCIDLPFNDSKNGNHLHLWNCNNTDAQKWRYDMNTQQIKHLQSNKCVDLNANIRDNGNRIQLWDCHNGDAQKWRREGNLFKLQNTNKCIDIPSGNLVDGNKLQLWECNNSMAQQFNLNSYITQCKKDEDFNTIWGSGGKTAKLKAMQECSEKGYYNNTINDCGDWKFSATCKDSVPSDWSRPYSDEHARELGKQNRDQAINDDCKSKGYMGYSGEWIEVGNFFNFSGKCVNPDYIGDWIKEPSTKIKYEKFSRHVDAKNFDWIEAGNFLLSKLPTHFNMKPIREKRLERRDHLNNVIPLDMTSFIGTRIVVVIEVEDITNVPKFKGEWVKSSCMNGILRLSNQVEAFNFGWDESAKYLLDSLGNTFDNKKIIKKWTEKHIGGQFIIIELEDLSCSSDNTPLITGNIPTCNFSKNGEFGDYNPLINNALTKESVFVLEAINWISGKENKKTFLRGDGGSIKTDDNVEISGNDLNRMYHFKLELDKCNQHSYITYGAKLQLKNIGTNKFIQCGAGTCSGVDNSGDCLNESWQTFKIVSASGKKDGEPVCYGDDIYFVQTVNMTASITPAGDGNVWAVSVGNNQNSILRILPVKGSLYNNSESILKEIGNYNKTILDELCKRDPSNIKCTEKNLKEAGNDLKNTIVLFGIIGIIILVLVLMIKLI
jgi:hypothetical protein